MTTHPHTAAPSMETAMIKPMQDKSLEGGCFEVSTEGDGKVMLSVMADSGEWQWYVMPPETAATLGAHLQDFAAQAKEDLSDG